MKGEQRTRGGEEIVDYKVLCTYIEEIARCFSPLLTTSFARTGDGRMRRLFPLNRVLYTFTVNYRNYQSNFHRLQQQREK